MPSTESKSTTTKLIEFFTSCWPTASHEASDMSARPLLSQEYKAIRDASNQESKTNKILNTKPTDFLHGLPEELWLENIDFLNASDLLNLMGTNTKFNALIIKKIEADLLNFPRNKAGETAVELIISLSEVSNEVASYILNLFEQDLLPDELVRLAGRSREEVAMRIVLSPYFQLFATPKNLGDLGAKYPKVAKYILGDPILHEVISSELNQLERFRRYQLSRSDEREPILDIVNVPAILTPTWNVDDTFMDPFNPTPRF